MQFSKYIFKKTALKGISPHCYKKDYHSLFPTVWISIFFYLFWKPAFDLVWPIMASNDIGNQTYIPYVTSYGCLSIHAKTYISGVVVKILQLVTFRGLWLTFVTYNYLQWHWWSNVHTLWDILWIFEYTCNKSYLWVVANFLPLVTFRGL